MIKKYNTYYKVFVLFLTIYLLQGCNPLVFRNTAIDAQKIAIDSNYVANTQIEAFVQPYRERLNRDLDSVLAYCPETLDKFKTIDKWQTTIGNLMADVTFSKAEAKFMELEKRHVDVCLLNHGGIRAIIAKGDVTTRTAFEIMPFENALLVEALYGEQLTEIAQYIISEKKPHPLAGMEIVITDDNRIVAVTVQGKPVEAGKIYNVATSDYLANGGDDMLFFKKAVKTYDLDYKLRDLYIDYFKETDTLPVITTKRIIVQ